MNCYFLKCIFTLIIHCLRLWLLMYRLFTNFDQPSDDIIFHSLCRYVNESRVEEKLDLTVNYFFSLRRKTNKPTKDKLSMKKNSTNLNKIKKLEKKTEAKKG